MNKTITIEVAYALPDRQAILKVSVRVESTIEAAIMQSGILDHFPDIDLGRQTVGVFGKRRELTDTIKEGDRIEIYRPLVMDPKEARRAKDRKLKKKKH